MTPDQSSADCTDYSLLDLNYARRTTVRRTDYFYSVVITTVPLLQYRRHETLSSRSSANPSPLASELVLLFSCEFSGISILGLVKEKFRIDAEKLVTVTR